MIETSEVFGIKPVRQERKGVDVFGRCRPVRQELPQLRSGAQGSRSPPFSLGLPGRDRSTPSQQVSCQHTTALGFQFFGSPADTCDQAIQKALSPPDVAQEREELRLITSAHIVPRNVLLEIVDQPAHGQTVVERTFDRKRF
jgi:hypothetical protein